MFFLSSFINYFVESFLYTNQDESALLFNNLVRTIENNREGVCRKTEHFNIENFERWMDFGSSSNEDFENHRANIFKDDGLSDIFERTVSSHKLRKKKTFKKPVKEQTCDQLGGVQKTAKTFMNLLHSAANEVGKTIVRFATAIKKTAEESNLLFELTDEQDSYYKTYSETKPNGGLAPWVGRLNENIIKEECLHLSADKRNFLSSPPPGVQFHFDYNRSYPDALAVMKHDSRLVKIRYELVPKVISEEIFWRNYFYRVNLICQANELLFMTEEDFSTDSEPSPRKIKNKAGGDTLSHKTYSTSRALTKIDETTTEFELSKDEENWNAEQRASSCSFKNTTSSPRLSSSYSESEIDAIIRELSE